MHFAIVLIAKVLKLLNVLLCTFGHEHNVHVCMDGNMWKEVQSYQGQFQDYIAQSKLGKHTFSLLISQHAKMMRQPLSKNLIACTQKVWLINVVMMFRDWHLDSGIIINLQNNIVFQFLWATFPNHYAWLGNVLMLELFFKSCF